jgi:hypothetical protein
MDNNVLKILIVEDEESQIIIYKDNIEKYNDEHNNISIEEDICSTLEDGMTALRNNNYDGAIVDLKLKNETYPEGNEILKEIKQHLRFPVVVCSGYLQDFDEEIGPENPLFKLHARGEIDPEDILDYFARLHRLGITKILGRKGMIDNYLTDIFWDHISSSLDYLSDDIEPYRSEKLLLRLTISYLQEYLDLDKDGGFDSYHSNEMYIIPSIKENYFTGDIFKKEDEFYIILSPACDMAQKKAKDIVIAQIEDLYMEPVKQQIREVEKDSNDAKKSSRLIDLLRNNYSFKYHFLPPVKEFKGGFINFQKLKSIREKNLDIKFKRIASVSNSFLKEITARFSYYYSRQGQPEFDYDKIYRELLENN